MTSKPRIQDRLTALKAVPPINYPEPTPIEHIPDATVTAVGEPLNPNTEEVPPGHVSIVAPTGEGKSRTIDMLQDAIAALPQGVDPWADIANSAVLVKPTFVRGPRVDITKTVPLSLRVLFEKSLFDYFRECGDGDEGGEELSKGERMPADSLKWREITLGTAEKVEEFSKHARQWAKYRSVEGEANGGQASVRIVKVKGDGPARVRFAFQPYVKRTVKPGGNVVKKVPNSIHGRARAWAVEQGRDVPTHGKVPQSLIDEYQTVVKEFAGRVDSAIEDMTEAPASDG